MTITTAFTPAVQHPARHSRGDYHLVIHPPRLHIKDAATGSRIACIDKYSDCVALYQFGDDPPTISRHAIEALRNYGDKHGVAVDSDAIADALRLDVEPAL
jgi:hypothetical protein